MPSSLFVNRNNGVLGLLKAIKGDPSSLVSNMMQSNPAFRQFCEQNKGKSPEQIAREHGINMDDVQNILNMIRK